MDSSGLNCRVALCNPFVLSGMAMAMGCYTVTLLHILTYARTPSYAVEV